jgi:competence protein ComEC
MELFHSGFLLSYGTVFGIAFFVRKFQENGSKNRLLCSLFGAVGIQMITLPIVLYFYYEVNPYSVFANLFVLPLVSVVIGMSVLAGFVTSWSLTAGKIFVGVVHEILMFYEWLCQCIEKLPWSDCILGRPAVWQIVLYYGLILLWCVWRKKRPRSGSHRWKGVLLVAALFVLCWHSSSDGSMMITNLDVGQGDCACVRLDGKTLLIDGGSSDVSSVGKYRISKYLKYYGISKIDYMFFSHADADHTNGLLEILEDNNFMGFQIGMVVLPGLEKKDENYQQLVEKCKKRGVAVAYMSKGDSLNVRGMAVRCLHPANDYDWTSENNYSLVLQLSYGDFQGVFMGDLEQGAESEIMNEITKSDYLKVAHHGSKGASSEELLKKIKPAIAVLSAGKNNRYGHPSPEVLERLQSVSAKSYCTIDEGAVTVSTDGKKILVDTYFSATYDKGRN